MSKYRFYYQYQWLFIGALLLIGLFMVYLGSDTIASAKRLAADPGHVTAEIIAKEYRSGRTMSKPGLAFTLEYTLSDSDGRTTYTSIANVERSTYENHDVGDTIDVRYDPEKPDVTEITKGAIREEGNTMLILSLGIFFLTCCMVLERPIRRFFGMNDPFT
ncbi:DUF3592 domain-containing protein [uncultured Roseibium sp.]|uniref:DUF3592 domain-containing protein n=1 Tax=uncultured Roseibium sp. TaxID=1936171 RepID=UPI0032165869